MLHIKFRGYWSTGSGEERFLKGFYHIWAWSCDPDAMNKLLLTLCKEAPHKIWL